MAENITGINEFSTNIRSPEFGDFDYYLVVTDTFQKLTNRSVWSKNEINKLTPKITKVSGSDSPVSVNNAYQTTYLLCTTDAEITINLPDDPLTTQIVYVKDISSNAGTNNITVKNTGGSDIVLSSDDANAHLVYDKDSESWIRIS